MSDLISRSELIKLINNKYIGLNDAVDLYNGGKFDCFQEIKLMIKKQPTVYDPDKVIEQLKGLHEGYKCTDNEFQRGAKAGAHYVLNRAIEIVKGGGSDGN